MSTLNDFGWAAIVFGIIAAAVETYRTSRFAHPMMSEVNRRFGAKSRIWGSIVMVAFGVLILAFGR